MAKHKKIKQVTNDRNTSQNQAQEYLYVYKISTTQQVWNPVKNEKKTTTWRLKNMLLENQWVND